MIRVLMLGILAATTAFAQVNTPPKVRRDVPPPATQSAPTPAAATSPGPEPNKVMLTQEEKGDVLMLQRDVEDSEIQAFSFKQKLDDQNKDVENKSKILNQKLDALRKAHGIPPDTFFNQKDVYFLLPPAAAKTPEKTP